MRQHGVYSAWCPCSPELPENENFPGCPGLLSGLSGFVGVLQPAPHSSQGAFQATFNVQVLPDFSKAVRVHRPSPGPPGTLSEFTGPFRGSPNGCQSSQVFLEAPRSFFRVPKSHPGFSDFPGFPWALPGCQSLQASQGPESSQVFAGGS